MLLKKVVLKQIATNLELRCPDFPHNYGPVDFKGFFIEFNLFGPLNDQLPTFYLSIHQSQIQVLMFNKKTLLEQPDRSIVVQIALFHCFGFNLT